MEGGGRRGYAALVAGLNLSPGEQVIFQGHPSWRALFGFYLKGVLVAAILGALDRFWSADHRQVAARLMS